VKNNLVLITIFLFILLFSAKIVLNGIYLGLDMAPFGGMDLALAEEGEKDQAVALEEMRRALRKKESELKQREADLKNREEELLPLKNEIDAKIQELNDLQTQLTRFAKDLAEREKSLEDAKIGHLVSLYSSMEAGRAAAIMDKLQIDTIVLILANMKGKSAGQILAMMDPEKGALISEKLCNLD
jgi:flagellar motility protein MotE (MotC chaperone)